MAIRLSVVQIGKGSIGGALLDQMAAERAPIRERLGVDLVCAGIAGQGGGSFERDGIDLHNWRETLRSTPGVDARGLLREAAGSIPGPKILVDATAAEGMAALYREALGEGFHVVACNKKPFAGRLADYRAAKDAGRAAGRFLLHEVTVGAGLPVISTLRDLVDSGDRIRSIEGCFSGTLNFLCAGLDRGGRFSEVLARARSLGFTEPDPREDLSGRDVARKALILAREAGLLIEPEQVRLEAFVAIDPGGGVEGFMAAAPGLDDAMRRSWRGAEERGMRRRYVAAVADACSARITDVPAGGPLGRLAGPENIFAFRTERYPDHPLLVTGPGAGPQVTAAGAFGDILRVARALALSGSGGRM